MSDAADRIARATTRLLLSRPWWASLLLHLKPVERGDLPTMATDGKHLFYNAAFTCELPAAELEGVLCHEVTHCALLHVFRRGSRDPERWNLACDAAGNAILLADGIALPAGCVPAADLTLTAEEIYTSLPAGAALPAALRDILAAAEGGAAEGGAAEGGAAEGEIEGIWRRAVAEAAGIAPAAIARRLNAEHAPKVDWRALLAQYITSYANRGGNTWMRRSRRLPGQMPGRRRDPEIGVGLIVDTSGSVGGALLDEFMSECKAILALNGLSAHLMAADAAVGLVVPPGEPWPDTLPGGGGTNFTPALAAMEQLDSVAVVIYYTDGAGVYPERCSKDVIWALPAAHPVPFGDVVILGDTP